ncbi:MAG TPA: ubiquinone/menaquinone biosynthesis methyltransferase [Acidimicrobiales bacterium]|nr:ubiquinone/menaquinone biosynthesis methyltransferase [Acidimicrobiales bacterium]
MSRTRTEETLQEALPEGSDKGRAVRVMFDAVAPRYDLVNAIMTFGLDRRWRRATVAALGLPRGSRVVDLACGTGDLCADLARAGLRPIGFDVSAGMLAAAHTTVSLVRADVASLPLPDGSVDGATCGFALRNLVDLPAFLTEVARIVRPGGRIGLLEVAEPSNRALRLGHRLYFTRVVPRIGAALSDGAAYRYLPRSVAYLPTVDALVGAVAAAGFPDADRRTFSGGVVQLLVGTRS